MGSPAEAAFDRWTRLAAALIGAPLATITLIDGHRAFFKSAVGLPEVLLPRREAPLTHSICKHVVQTGAPLVFADGSTHPLVRDNPAVSEYGIIAYAGMPLTLRCGTTLGALCVVDAERREWTAAEQATLKDLAAAVTTELELRVALAAQQDVLAVVAHDLKGPLMAIGLSATLATPLLEDAPPRAQRAMGRIASAAKRMEALVYQILDGGGQARHRQDAAGAGEPVLAAEPTLAAVPARALVDAALDSIRALAEERRVRPVSGAVSTGLAVWCDAVRLGQAIGNLAHNAVEHAPPGTAVTIGCRLVGGQVEIRVEDEGEGVPEHERARLFRRGERGRNVQRRGHGLGLTIADTYVRAHHGTLAVRDREAGPGACFVICLPHRGEAAAEGSGVR